MKNNFEIIFNSVETYSHSTISEKVVINLHVHTLLNFVFESTFIKAGDSETQKYLGEKKPQESTGGGVWAHWEVRAKGALETGSRV